MLNTTLAPAPTRVKSPTDLDLLQGAWTSVAGLRSAKLLIAGDRFTFELLDGDIYMGTFFLDSEEEPKQIDMLIEAGPSKVKGLIALCIYQVEGDILRWCPTKPGADRRLRSFPGVEDERYLSLIFKRARPRRS
jgi:uncharacterized protein (TIGR03067 family)